MTNLLDWFRHTVIESELLPILSAVLLGIGTGLLLPHKHGRTQPRIIHVLGGVLCALGIGAFAALLTRSTDLIATFHLYAFAALALAAAVLTISARDPVYNALWFAVVLLATSGLFLLVGAQFLAAGTVIVYAGAVVVTFLFVIMLAQSEGQAPYDRMARSPLRSTAVAFLLFAGLMYGVWRVNASVYRPMRVPDNSRPSPAAPRGGPGGGGARPGLSATAAAETRRPGPGPGPGGAPAPSGGNSPDRPYRLVEHDLTGGDFEQRLVQTADLVKRATDPLKGSPLKPVGFNATGEELLAALRGTLSASNTQIIGSSEEAGRGEPPQHIAGLGGTLFTDHLVTVEVAGAVLFIALVGAVSIATPRLGRRPETHS